MSGFYFSQDKIDEVREAADIVEVIGSYITIKKTGKNYTALCPFHSEKKPSFVISPEKQIYHCFGCGASGNVFTFVMNYESVNFAEAVEILAKRYGIKVKVSSGTDDKIKKSLLKVNNFAFDFFKKHLNNTSGKKALDYVKKRKINRETVELFGIGYAPSGWSNLLNAARKEGISEKLLVQSGLIVKADSGKLYDTFRNRLIFTFYNTRGEKVAFAGRALGDDEPKYLNISETPLFKKRFTLYGLYQGKDAIRKEDRCLVVEGYMDLLALFQAGFKNVVAVSGTSLTDGQAQLLRKYTRNVYISFDADNAGKKAALKGISIFINNGLTPYVITLKGGKDPDEIIKKEGSEPFQKMIKHAEHFVDFKLRYLLSRYDAENPVDRTEIVKEMARTISYIKDMTERQMWVSSVARKLSIDETVLSGYRITAKQKSQFLPSILSSDELVHNLVALISLNPARYNEVYELLEETELLDDVAEKVLLYIKTRFDRASEVDVADVINMYENNSERERITAMIFSLKKENLPKMLTQYINKVKTISLKKRWENLKKEIKKNENDNNIVLPLLKEQQKIASILKKLGGNIDPEERV